MDNTTRYERLLDRYREGGLPRRTFLGLIGASAAAYGVMGGPFSGFARAQDVKQVRFDGWGGVVSEAFREHAFNPYTEKTGITVVDGTFGGADEYLARIKAGQPGEFNLAHLSGVFDYARYHHQGLSSVLNEENIPNLANVIPALQDVFRKITDGTLSAVPYNYGTTGLAYNRKHISDEEIAEKGANILIDQAYKGKIGGWSDWKTRIWYAALQTGQDPNKIEDMEAVWDAIRTSRDTVLKFWASGAELMSLLAEEEIYVTEGWSGRIRALQDQGHDIGYFDPPGGLGWQECIFVLKGSPMGACEELVNFMLEPEVAIAVAEGQFYPPALDPNKVDLGKIVPSLPAFDPAGTLASLNFFEPEYWNSHEAEWAKQYGRVEAGY
ncbi:spermidine/putrescine ABC transporter substrate-binding protein [Phyllobacterium phragmitis]|uniref:Spermidine/putrescine ABC transporter substrate-binding protein n=1 Tax=Phyllobacterium phragmitis TaxID=2670329 RepID=A0A2S9IWE1_9HYPH|nr:extracellular solute-binding protein [Phyllobacterium phragmitis]PRD44837.1 spermidine/putrescine ABC transporter substrate-binding protein [Phyllobacterium phragmitis]